MEKVTFAGGCFWCTEAIFKRIKGVNSVQSGYAGSTIKNPSYAQVSSGMTDAAEAIQVSFDPKIVFFQTLLDIFFATHDPTTRNRQGNDVGTQYRSAVFYHSDKQKQQAESTKESLQQSGNYKDPIVTEIVPYINFYSAEAEHKDYYDKNQTAPYCKLVIDPKIQKLLKKFSKEIKAEYQIMKPEK